MTEKAEHILPVRFDDTAVEGLLPTVGYLDARRISSEVLASKINELAGDRDSWLVYWREEVELNLELKRIEAAHASAKARF